MYADYLKERLGDECLILDEGFASYRYLEANGVKSVYIVDIYVRPDFRKAGIAAEMADKICAIAKEKGCTQLIGTVSPTANGATDSLKVLLGYGMKLESASQNAIIFRKDI